MHPVRRRAGCGGSKAVPETTYCGALSIQRSEVRSFAGVDPGTSGEFQLNAREGASVQHPTQLGGARAHVGRHL